MGGRIGNPPVYDIEGKRRPNGDAYGCECRYCRPDLGKMFTVSTHYPKKKPEKKRIPMVYDEAMVRVKKWCKEAGENDPGGQSVVILARAATMYLNSTDDESDRAWRSLVNMWPMTANSLARTNDDVEEALDDIQKGGSN